MKKAIVILVVMALVLASAWAEGFIGAGVGYLASGQVYDDNTKAVVSFCLPLGVIWEQDINWFAVGGQITINNAYWKPYGDTDILEKKPFLLSIGVPISYHKATSDFLNFNVGMIVKADFTLASKTFRNIDLSIGGETSMRFDIANKFGISLGLEVSTAFYSARAEGDSKLEHFKNLKFNVVPKLALGYVY